MRFARTMFTIALTVSLSAGITAARTAVPVVQASRIQQGLNEIYSYTNIPTGGDPRAAVIDSIRFILSFLALAAVVMIIVAGFFLVLGGGSEAAAGRAKKIILYTVIGLVVIFFARVIVGFFTEELSSAI